MYVVLVIHKSQRLWSDFQIIFISLALSLTLPLSLAFLSLDCVSMANNNNHNNDNICIYVYVCIYIQYVYPKHKCIRLKRNLALVTWCITKVVVEYEKVPFNSYKKRIDLVLSSISLSLSLVSRGPSILYSFLTIRCPFPNRRAWSL